MIPKSFFVTSGKAVSKVSTLNAFDLALKAAGLSECNIVRVSSIIPPNCVETKPKKIPVGSITYAVMAAAEGTGGTISAGIAYGIDEEEGYGLVAEAYGCMDQASLRKELERRLAEMARVRGIELDNTKYRIETLEVPEGSHGSVLAALVYIV
ncbi:MAG: pyruvoyl-dependent arginine decarboxylase [Candidatus Bathyarchaeota archaeon]|nr:pyruvoyl-dependent arginine decarboxylase [Candidatus Bathyarchaeota archaeon]